MDKVVNAIFAILLAFNYSLVASTVVKNGILELELTPTKNGINLIITTNDTDNKLTGTLALNRDVSNVACIAEDSCQIDDSTLTFKTVSNGFEFKWETQNRNTKFTDCFDFHKDVHWFGGPEKRQQIWPLQKMTLDGNTPYIIRGKDNTAVAERYWLNSKGAYIYLDEKNPLFVSQNELNSLYDGNVCFISKLQNPYVNRTRNILEYTIIVKENAKEAHLHAVNTFLGKPTGHPFTSMITEPIWTTWAKYKKEINDDVVLEFAQSIRDHGYENGQLEIDDEWEKCYGAEEFIPSKFSNISGVVKQLKNMNFRVTLWMHPFVNDNCQNNSKIGLENNYFVRNQIGSTRAVWWNAFNGQQIDFTNKEAADWWSNRLKNLQTVTGIDSYKFDAGESDYSLLPWVFPNVDQELIPNILTSTYIRKCAEFGDLIEVRSAWRTQDLPFFVRMLDKDSNWSGDNGLPTLVTTLLQMNMNGYTMVLPDMIGGNGYLLQNPSAELIVRWTQANTFMPAMQFSYLPWDFTSSEYKPSEIVQKFVKLHKDYSDSILKAMENSIQFGSPVNPPIWWIDPTDPIALATNDEFLVGEDILVAPVLAENQRSRSVYLPIGTWRDGNNDTLYQGPVTLDYPVPIDVLPYFIKE